MSLVGPRPPPTLSAAATSAAGGANDGPLTAMPEEQLEKAVRAQLRKRADTSLVFRTLRLTAESGRRISGNMFVDLGVLARVQRRIESEQEGALKKDDEADTKRRRTEEQASSALAPAATTAAARAAHAARVPAIAPAKVLPSPSRAPPSEVVAASAEARLRDGADDKLAAKEEAVVARPSCEDRQAAEEVVVNLLKEQRLQEIISEMDEQMRGWCRSLAARQCRGEPWRNVGGNKLRVLVEPRLGAPSFEGEYVAPGATFGVEEVRPEGESRWLRLVRGGWVSDHSKKRTSVKVAVKAERHAEIADEDTFQLGAGEDRREAYMRMVHRKGEPDLQVPEGLKVELMPYQVEGMEWLVSLFNNDLAGLLADEMGLGKTIQSLALIAFLKETKKRYGPHLIICPKSVVSNWQKEIEQCFPEYTDHLIVYQGTPAQREELAKKVRKAVSKDKKKLIVVTNYEQVHPDRNQVLHEPKWELIIIDEGHRMKNQKTVFHQTMKELFTARMKLLLTGTPVQNSLDELFSLLSYLLPEIFTSASSFKAWFAAPFLNKLESMNMSEYSVDFTEEQEQLLLSNLHAMLAPFVLQRTKADVLSLEQLPPRREVVLRVPLSAWQASTYEDLKARTLRRMDAEGGDVSHELVRNTTMQLRKIALHPYLFGRGGGERRAEDIVRASGKFEALDRLLRKLRPCGHRVLIFSQFTTALDLLEELMRLREWSFERIDGQVSADERKLRISRFSDPQSEAFVFLLSARAGAVGLNLQAADTVVLLDLDWNPQNDKQAIARAHRLGQTKEVLVVRLLTLSAIEEHMEKVAEEKLHLEKKIIGAGGFSGHSKSPEERAALLRDLLAASSSGRGSQHQATALREANASLSRSPAEEKLFAAEDASLGLTYTSGASAEAASAEVAVALVRSGRLMATEEVPEAFEAREDDSDSE